MGDASSGPNRDPVTMLIAFSVDDYAKKTAGATIDRTVPLRDDGRVWGSRLRRTLR